jgi:hypothetical protein
MRGSNKSFDKLCTTMNGLGVFEDVGDGTFDESKSPFEKPSSFALKPTYISKLTPPTEQR